MNDQTPSKALATMRAGAAALDIDAERRYATRLISPRSNRPMFKGHKQTDFSDKDERWLPVQGWPYEVSSKGRVRSLRLIQPHTSADGYERVHFYDGQNTLHPLIHRLVATAFIGDPPSIHHVVSHKNGNPSDNRPENLCWATVDENVKQKIEHGNYAKGEDVYNSKITYEQAREMRRLFNSSKRVTVSGIARQFGVSRTLVSKVIRGITYVEAGGEGV